MQQLSRKNILTSVLILITLILNGCSSLVVENQAPQISIKPQYICNVTAAGETSCISSDFLEDLYEYSERGPEIASMINDVYSTVSIDQSRNALLQCSGLWWASQSFTPSTSDAVGIPDMGQTAIMREECSETFLSIVTQMGSDSPFRGNYHQMVEAAVNEMDDQVAACTDPYYGGMATGPIAAAGAAAADWVSIFLAEQGLEISFSLGWEILTNIFTEGDVETEEQMQGGEYDNEGYNQSQAQTTVGVSFFSGERSEESKGEVIKQYEKTSRSGDNNTTVTKETWSVTKTIVTTSTDNTTGTTTETTETTTETWTRETTYDANRNIVSTTGIVKQPSKSESTSKVVPKKVAGTRGDCGIDFNCSSPCENLREAWNKLKLQCASNNWQDYACVMVVTSLSGAGYCVGDPRIMVPLPDGTYTCGVLASSEMIAEAQKGFCEKQGGVMSPGTDRETTHCSIAKPIEFDIELSICNDPHIVLADDQCLLNLEIPMPWTEPTEPTHVPGLDVTPLIP